MSQCYLFVGLFSIGVILHLVFFSLMINGYTPLIEIFLFSSFTYYYFFYIKILFSLASTYDISFLQIHTTIFFSFSILVHYKCQSKMNNLCFISNSVKGLQAISKRKKITSLQMVSFFFKKHNLPLEMRRYGMMNLEDSYSLMVKPILVVLLLVLLVQRL